MVSKPLAPTSRPSKKERKVTPLVATIGSSPAASVSKTALHPVFVYGSLKRNFPLSDWLKDQDYVGSAVVSKHTLISLGQYPAMIHTGLDEDAVTGEYYLVSDDVFKALSRMEERAGYATVRVSGKFINASTPTLSASDFKANAWLFASIQRGVAVWESFDHKGDIYQYVNYHKEDDKS